MITNLAQIRKDVVLEAMTHSRGTWVHCRRCVAGVAFLATQDAHTASEPWERLQGLIEAIDGPLGLSRPMYAIVRDLDGAS